MPRTGLMILDKCQKKQLFQIDHPHHGEKIFLSFLCKQKYSHILHIHTHAPDMVSETLISGFCSIQIVLYTTKYLEASYNRYY